MRLTRASVVIAIVGALYKEVPGLIERLSADGDHVPTDALAQLEALDGAFDRVAASFAV